MLKQQIEVLGHRPGECVLNWNHRRLCSLLEHTIEYLSGSGTRKHTTAGRHSQSSLMAERTSFPLNGNFHELSIVNTLSCSAAQLSILCNPCLSALFLLQYVSVKICGGGGGRRLWALFVILLVVGVLGVVGRRTLLGVLFLLVVLALVG